MQIHSPGGVGPHGSTLSGVFCVLKQSLHQQHKLQQTHRVPTGEVLQRGCPPWVSTGMCANCLAHGVAQVDTARAVSLVWSSKGVNPDGQSNVALYHTDVEPREQKERSDGPRQHRRQHSQRGQGEEQSDEEGHSHCTDSKRHSASPASSHASPTAIVTYRVGSVFGFNFHDVRTGPSSL